MYCLWRWKCVFMPNNIFWFWLDLYIYIHVYIGNMFKPIDLVINTCTGLLLRPLFRRSLFLLVAVYCFIYTLISLFNYDLQYNQTIEELDLSWNGLSEEGCRALGTSLPFNHTLRELDVTCNRISPFALKHLLTGLEKNDTMKTFRVSIYFGI